MGEDLVCKNVLIQPESASGKHILGVLIRDSLTVPAIKALVNCKLQMVIHFRLGDYFKISASISDS